MTIKKQYLGDGLYAEFNGYQIILKANNEISPSDVVYMDDSVVESFLHFIESIKEELTTVAV